MGTFDKLNRRLTKITNHFHDLILYGHDAYKLTSILRNVNEDEHEPGREQPVTDLCTSYADPCELLNAC